MFKTSLLLLNFCLCIVPTSYILFNAGIFYRISYLNVHFVNDFKNIEFYKLYRFYVTDLLVLSTTFRECNTPAKSLKRQVHVLGFEINKN